LELANISAEKNTIFVQKTAFLWEKYR